MPYDPVLQSLCEAHQLGLCVYFMGRILKEFHLHAWVKDVIGDDDTSKFCFIFLGNGFDNAQCASFEVFHALLNRGGIWTRGIMAHVMPWDPQFQPKKEYFSFCVVWVSPNTLFPTYSDYCCFIGRSLVCPLAKISYAKQGRQGVFYGTCKNWCLPS